MVWNSGIKDGDGVNGLNKDNEGSILGLIGSRRIPHTVIIEGADKDERSKAALLLAAGAVCREDVRPCMSCTACRKAAEGIHPDIFVPEPGKNLKSGILSLKDLRDGYLSQMSIKPNEADIKVYIFSEADRLLREDAQNALLKTIEEPPQNLLFIFTAESAKSLLLTVRSRARVITLSRSAATDSEGEENAARIAEGIVSPHEYGLLLTLSGLSDKDALTAALTAFTEILRQALSFYSGIPTSDESVKRLTRKLNRSKVISLTEVTGEAVTRLKTNVNIQLLTTWLSSQYRRITWQK